MTLRCGRCRLDITKLYGCDDDCAQCGPDSRLAQLSAVAAELALYFDRNKKNNVFAHIDGVDGDALQEQIDYWERAYVQQFAREYPSLWALIKDEA